MAVSASGPPLEARPTRKVHLGRDIAILLLFIAIGVLVLAALGAFSGSESFVQQHTQTIVNGTVTVVAGNYTAFKITIPSGATGARVTGSFTASGSLTTGIQVYVMDSSNFASWLNGHSFLAYYDSGRVMTGDIDAQVPVSGTYYLVYSNLFSALASKTVVTAASLAYTA